MVRFQPEVFGGLKNLSPPPKSKLLNNLLQLILTNGLTQSYCPYVDFFFFPLACFPEVSLLVLADKVWVPCLQVAALYFPLWLFIAQLLRGLYFCCVFPLFSIWFWVVSEFIVSFCNNNRCQRGLSHVIDCVDQNRIDRRWTGPLHMSRRCILKVLWDLKEGKDMILTWGIFCFPHWWIDGRWCSCDVVFFTYGLQNISEESRILLPFVGG